jgi:hypothetical protein
VTHPVGIGMNRSPDLYAGSTEPWHYGNDDTSYFRAGAYLSGPGLVEDWGCGTTYARRFIGAPYRGVDGIASSFLEGKMSRVSLSEYRSRVPKILMRHVLEHNWDWRDILRNMVGSFTDRAVLVLFLRPGPEDRNVSGRTNRDDDEWPGLELCERDLHDILAGESGGLHGGEWTYEDMETQTPPYNYERIYFLKKGTSL